MLDATDALEPRVLHAIPGRLRVHLPQWGGRREGELETAFACEPGVVSARACSSTGNVVLQYDVGLTDPGRILSGARTIQSRVHEAARTGAPSGSGAAAAADKGERGAAPPAFVHTHGGRTRARIAVRGIERSPALAARVVHALHARAPGIRATASALTGRVLIEFQESDISLEELVATVGNLEMPELPGEDRPSHPLDPGPLWQSASRLVGASLGLVIVATRQARGGASGYLPAARIAGLLSLVQSLPPVRAVARRTFGPDRAAMVMSIPTIVAMTFSGGTLGLLLATVESLQLLTEVRARREAWSRYEGRLEDSGPGIIGTHTRLDSGDVVPASGRIVEGRGFAEGDDGEPEGVGPGSLVTAGAMLRGGPFVLELTGATSFPHVYRAIPVTPTSYDRYLGVAPAAAFAYAIAMGLFTRSAERTLIALLLVNQRAALIGAESADTAAASRVLRAGVTIVGSRPDRQIRLPHTLVIDCPRTLIDGYEVVETLALVGSGDPHGVAVIASAVAAAAGSPWGPPWVRGNTVRAADGQFDGTAAHGEIGGVWYSLSELPDSDDALSPEVRARTAGDYLLVLRAGRTAERLGVLVLRPRLAPGMAELVSTCHTHGVSLILVADDDPAVSAATARRAGVPLLAERETVSVIQERQARGQRVALLSDGVHAPAGFDACDLGIAVTDFRHRFPARADLLAADLRAVASVIDAGARREASVRDAVFLSVAGNVAGLVWGVRATPNAIIAPRLVQGVAMLTVADSWLRARGGESRASGLVRVVDPHPERWGGRDADDALRRLRASREGLSTRQALARRTVSAFAPTALSIWHVVLDELQTPVVSMLVVAAGFSLATGAPGDALILGATIGLNVAFGVWQARNADTVISTLGRLGAGRARVLRDGMAAMVDSSELVPGDILLLTAGDRVSADARLLEADNLEIDEATLTGESFPVEKRAEGGDDGAHVVLDGTGVSSGTGVAVVFAVGRGTRLGGTTAAVAAVGPPENPLNVRLGELLHRVLPAAAAGGVLVTITGLLRGKPLLPQLAIGTSIMISAVPEGLPLLANMGQAAVARRLAARGAVVRRLAAVEALGRVDVACVDKTGTLTEGRLAVQVITDADGTSFPVSALPAGPRRVLVTAGLASPHPDDWSAAADATDVAVARAADAAGLSPRIRLPRTRELHFEAGHAFHATVVAGMVRVKGAPESLVDRCRFIRSKGRIHLLTPDGRAALLERAALLAARGFRVLLVAESRGTVEDNGELDDPRDLVALGFLGIADPLRPSVLSAVRRCREAGVRVVMLTGDHPATARAIAEAAGILGDGDVLTGAALLDLSEEELTVRLRHATVIARVTPLDKLRIVQSLQERGHTVAMTGDGVNDAAALRLANVGIAMGEGGTEVARQAADLVLLHNDIELLADAFVEGRSFWGNLRRAIGLLLGGNLGEMGAVVGATALGSASPLTVRQVLVVNMITDALPAIAIAMQPPQHQHLAGLAREGRAAFDAPLRHDVLRRAVATAVPTLASYFIMAGRGNVAAAQTVAFSSVVATQLTQTVQAGREGGTLTRAVGASVGVSALVLLATVSVSPLRNVLGLVVPSAFEWALIGGSAALAPLINRSLALRLGVPTPQMVGAPSGVLVT